MLRDTLCSCEAYEVRPKYKTKSAPRTTHPKSRETSRSAGDDAVDVDADMVVPVCDGRPKLREPPATNNDRGELRMKLLSCKQLDWG